MTSSDKRCCCEKPNRSFQEPWEKPWCLTCEKPIAPIQDEPEGEDAHGLMKAMHEPTPSATEWEMTFEKEFGRVLEMVINLGGAGTFKDAIKSFIAKELTAARIEGEEIGRNEAVEYIWARTINEADAPLDQPVHLVPNSVLQAARKGEVE